MREVWLFQTGEPILTDSNYTRPMRCMNLLDVFLSKGFKVRVFTTNFFHQEKTNRFESYTCIHGPNYEIHFVESPGYRSNISPGRFYDHFMLGRNLSKLLCTFKEKPDFVVIGFPPIEFAYSAATYCIENDIPFTVDVKDKWPDFFYSKAARIFHPFLKLGLFYYEIQTKFIFGSADFITTISASYLRWASEKAARPVKSSDRILYLSDLGSSQVVEHPIEVGDLIGDYSEDNIYIVFFGTLASSFDFGFLDACVESYSGSNVRFLICGDGDNLSSLKSKYSGEIVQFTGWVNKEQLSCLANISSMALAPYIRVDNFLDNIPNKIIDYMKFGLPILTSLNGEVGDIISESNIGLVYSDNENFIDALNFLLENDDLLATMSKNCKELHQVRFDGDVNYQSYVDFVSDYYYGY